MQFTSQTKIGNSNTVYVIQDIPGTKIGAPKINIIGATQYGQLKVLLPENSQIILSPAYVITTLKQKLKDYKSNDYLLLTGDPAIIGVACSIVFKIYCHNFLSFLYIFYFFIVKFYYTNQFQQDNIFFLVCPILIIYICH